GAAQLAIAAQSCDGVCDVLVTFGVVAGQRLAAPRQQCAVEGAHARVDLVDRVLFGVGVGVLDDLGEGAGGVSYDAAVAVGVGHASYETPPGQIGRAHV